MIFNVKLLMIIYIYIYIFNDNEVNVLNFLGAFSAICDVGEYRKCAREFKIDVVVKIFDTLHALCSLLLVLPKDLPISFNREELVRILLLLDFILIQYFAMSFNYD